MSGFKKFKIIKMNKVNKVNKKTFDWYCLWHIKTYPFFKRMVKKQYQDMNFNYFGEISNITKRW